MNAKQYINEVLRYVQTDRKTKQRLREDLTQDIEGRMQQGEPLSEILLVMGSPQAAAARLQESIGGYAREVSLGERALQFTAVVFAVVGLFGLFQITFALIAGWFYSSQNIALVSDATVTISTYITRLDNGTITIDVLPYLIPAGLLLISLCCYLLYRRLRRRK